jgi:hypothetical protein
VPQQTTGAAYILWNDLTTGNGIICMSDTAGVGCGSASAVAHDINIASAQGIDLFTGAALTVKANGVAIGGNAASAVLSLASTTASAACTLNGSVSRNIASCTTNAGGTVTTVTFTTTLVSAPICELTQNSGTGATLAAVISSAPLPTTGGFTVTQTASPGPGYMVYCFT